MTGRGFNFRHKDRSRRALRSPVRVGQEGTSETKLRSRFTRSHDFVFATFVGTPLDPGNFVRREFRPALARAGLNFRFHDLRHFAVSALIAEGADIKLLQAIVGHASATMTLDTYGHLMTARVSEAATRYDPLARRHPADNVSSRGRRAVDRAPVRKGWTGLNSLL